MLDFLPQRLAAAQPEDARVLVPLARYFHLKNTRPAADGAGPMPPGGSLEAGVLDYRAILAAAFAAGYAGPLTIEFLTLRAQAGRGEARLRRALRPCGARGARPRMKERFPRVATLRTAAALRARLTELGCPLPCDDVVESGPEAPLARPLALGPGPRGALTAPNRFVIQPMEGWDGTADGLPSELTERRWRRFGASGAGWIWGGEAVAVRRDGRANARQLVIDAATAPALAKLREALAGEALRAGHAAPVVGLQLTHSGRFAVDGAGARAPRVAMRHPLLDPRTGVAGDGAVLADAELDALVGDYARAAARAAAAGFDFVDVKHCHGYLLHEVLGARTRAGRYGGASLAERSALTFALLDAIAREAPALRIGVRLSVFDAVPHRSDPARGCGAPEPLPSGYPHGFGCDAGRPAPRRPRRADRLRALARRARRRVAQRDRGEPVLRAAPPAARALPAVGRLRTARGSALRRRPPPRRGARDEDRAPRRLRRFLGLELPPGLDPARRAGLPARGLVRRGRARPRGTLLSGSPRRRDRRAARSRAARLPDLQRLHDRAAQRVSSRAATRSTTSTASAPSARRSKPRSGAPRGERAELARLPRSRACARGPSTASPPRCSPTPRRVGPTSRRSSATWRAPRAPASTSP